MRRQGKGTRMREILSVGALSVALLALPHWAAVPGPAAARAASASTSAKPPHFKACGAIHAKGRRQRVDITEARGAVSHRCSSARAVMRRFLHKAPGAYTGPNSAQVTFGPRTFSCYASRPDGEGWDYHCGWFVSGSDAFIDYGAGRRF